MVGVSDPEMQQDRRKGWRFLFGLGSGYLITSLLVGVLVALVALTVQSALPQHVARYIASVVLIVLGVADWLSRTLQANRQVPQRFARDLQPGIRGIVWGLDLGLLVTTQKTSSLLWGGLCLTILTSNPAIGFVVPIVGFVPYFIGVVTQTVRKRSRMTDLGYGRHGIPVLRKVGGVMLVFAALGVIV